MILILSWLRDGRRFNSDDVVDYYQDEVSKRTVKNDIENLRTLGYHIEYDYGHKSYRMVDDSGDLPLPQIRDSELAVLELSCQMIESLGSAPLSETADRFVDRLRNVLPMLTSEDAGVYSPSFRVLNAPKAEVSFPFWEELDHAIKHHLSVKMRYYTMYRDATTDRMVDPYKLLSKDGRSYMMAWCHKRKEVSIFRLDRIRKLVVTDKAFDIDPEFDESEFLDPMFGIFNDGKPFKVKVRFSPWVARWIREDRWHPSQKFTEMSDGSLQVDMKVTGTIDVKRWILSFGRDAEVLAPEHLRKAITYDAEVMRETYSNVTWTFCRSVKSRCTLYVRCCLANQPR